MTNDVHPGEHKAHTAQSAPRRGPRRSSDRLTSRPDREDLQLLQYATNNSAGNTRPEKVELPWFVVNGIGPRLHSVRPEISRIPL